VISEKKKDKGIAFTLFVVKSWQKKMVAVRRIDVISHSGQLVEDVETLSERERANYFLAMPK